MTRPGAFSGRGPPGKILRWEGSVEACMLDEFDVDAEALGEAREFANRPPQGFEWKPLPPGLENYLRARAQADGGRWQPTRAVQLPDATWEPVSYHPGPMLLLLLRRSGDAYRIWVTMSNQARPTRSWRAREGRSWDAGQSAKE